MNGVEYQIRTFGMYNGFLEGWMLSVFYVPSGLWSENLYLWAMIFGDVE